MPPHEQHRPLATPREHRAAIIVGAGAAGLMTAIAAARARPGLDLLLLEGARKPGAKILISGGGRCNVTNARVLARDYHGDRKRIDRVLRRFGVSETLAFFEELGVTLKHEPEFAKLFPASDSARTVLAALTGAVARAGVELRAGQRVVAVSRAGDRFELELAGGGALSCDRLVLATGGRSLPKSGSDGAGYALAQALGHSVTATWPALVALVLQPHRLEGLAGVSFPAALEVWWRGRLAARAKGPALVTHFGLSGPVALDASRHITTLSDEAEQPLVSLSFFPDESPEDLERRWLERSRAGGGASVRRLLDGLPQRLCEALLELAGIASDTKLAALDRAHRRRLLETVTALPLPVAGTRGFREAEVTAGGVPLDELDLASMESRLAPGLHLVGEILDVDGRLGGFNFQWAWASGHVAGSAFGRDR